MNYRKITLYFSFLLGLICFSACESVTSEASSGAADVPKEDEALQVPFLEAQKHYYHAYLAYCVDSEEYRDVTHGAEGATKHILGIAQERIDSVIGSPAVVNLFGQDSLVWGPALIVDDQGNGLYTPENVMYCLKKVGSDDYYIGIAGTNMLSPFDWFTEDLLVHQQENWLAGGKIAKGSLVAFNKINSLMDTKTGYTLVEFLEEKLTQNPNVKISVAGHSLGGALTQVYASYLTYRFKDPKTKIEAWPYAGPTAGNSAFAETLLDSVDSYNAYNNSFDMIPHAWQTDSLKQICSLYSNRFQLCGTTLENNPPFNAAAKYLIDLSVGLDYKIPGKPNQFVGRYPVLDCKDFKHKIDKLWDLTEIPDTLRLITKLCTNHKPKWRDHYFHFFYHMAGMADQHTSAYFDHFFSSTDNETRMEAFKTVINKYVPAGKMTPEKIWEGKDIIEDFLGEIKKADIVDCNCD